MVSPCAAVSVLLMMCCAFCMFSALFSAGVRTICVCASSRSSSSRSGTLTGCIAMLTLLLLHTLLDKPADDQGAQRAQTKKHEQRDAQSEKKLKQLHAHVIHRPGAPSGVASGVRESSHQIQSPKARSSHRHTAQLWCLGSR